MESLAGQLLIASPAIVDPNFRRTVVFLTAHTDDGAIGLILPGLTRIRTELTPLAAAGLVAIMIGATVVSAIQGPVFGALIPAVVGTLALYVARGRWQRAAQPVPAYRSAPALRRAA